MKRNKPKCPYCNERLNFSQAFKVKTHDKYVCKKCGQISQIEINPSIKNLAKTLAILVSIVAIIFSFVVKSYIWGAIIITILFIAFYIQVPRFMELIE